MTRQARAVPLSQKAINPITSDGRQDEELDTRIGKPKAVIRALHYSVAMKREYCQKRQSSQFSEQFLFPFSPMVKNLT